MSYSSEAVFAALFAKVSAAYAWKATPSRRLKLWDAVPAEEMPALFQFEGEHDTYAWDRDLVLLRTLHARLFVYINAQDPTAIGAMQVNNILDALILALAPSGTDQFSNQQTLGGLVSSCRIVGQILKDPGDLDGIGLIMIPIAIVWP